MTVTVISIIAVIVVLAVLLLLLLGMRALNPSRAEEHEAFEDDYEYDGDGPEREGDTPRGRGRRPRRQLDKPGFLKRRRVDWDDDEDGLSDNDFWSSLNEEGPAQRPAQGRERGYDGYDDGYRDHGYGEGPYEDEYEDEYGYDDRQGPPTPATGTDLRPDQGRHAARSAPDGPGPQTNMMALADLGQENGPQQSHAPAADTGQGPSAGPVQPDPSPPEQPSSLPSAQETHGLPAANPVGEDSDPLGPGSWSSPPAALPPRSEEAPEGPLSAPSNGPGSPYPAATGQGTGGTPSPYGGPFAPGQGGSYGTGPSYDGSAPSRSDEESTRPSSDPLDPNFRPAPGNSGPDMPSPIWSSMDTGAHQRPDPSVLGAPEPPVSGGTSSPGAFTDPVQPGTADPLGGYGAQFGHGGFTEPAQGQPFDSGNRPGQGRPPLWGDPNDTGSHARPPQAETPSWSNPNDTGSHARTQEPGQGGPEDTGPYTFTGQGPSLWTDPVDSGSHARPGPARTPWNNPGDTGGHNRPWDAGTPAFTGQETDPYGRQPSPYDSGTHTRPGGLGTGMPGSGWENPAGAPSGGVPTGHPGGTYGTPGWGSGTPAESSGPPPSAQETDPYGRQSSPHDSGTHTYPAPGGTPPWGNPNDTGAYAQPQGPGWGAPNDTGAYARPPQAATSPSWTDPNDTGAYAQPQGPVRGEPEETGTPAFAGWETDPYGRQPSPHDSGTHTYPAPGGTPPWGNPNDTGAYAQPGPARTPWNNPGDTGGHNRPWDAGTPAFTGQETDPYGRQPSPYDSGTHTYPAPGGTPPWGAPVDGGAPSAPPQAQGGYGPFGGPSPYDSGTHPIQSAPTGPPQGNPPQPGPGHNPGQYGPGELFDGGYAPPSQSQHGGPAPYEGWGGPVQNETTDLYPRDAYGRPLPPPEGYYEGNYEDGRYR